MKKKGLLIFSLLGGLVLTSCGDIQFDTKTPTDEGGNEIIPSDPEVLPDDPSTEDPSNPETPEIDLPEYVDNFIYTLLTYDYTSGVRFNLDISAYQIPTELESELVAFLNLPFDIDIKYNQDSIDSKNYLDAINFKISTIRPTTSDFLGVVLQMLPSFMPEINYLSLTNFKSLSVDYIGDGYLYTSLNAAGKTTTNDVTTWNEEESAILMEQTNLGEALGGTLVDTILPMLPNLPSDDIINEIIPIISNLIEEEKVGNDTILSLNTIGTALINTLWGDLYNQLLDMASNLDGLAGIFLPALIPQFVPQVINDINVIFSEDESSKWTNLELKIIAETTIQEETRVFDWLTIDLNKDNYTFSDDYFENNKTLVQNKLSDYNNLLAVRTKMDELHADYTNYGSVITETEYFKNEVKSVLSQYETLSTYQLDGLNGYNTRFTTYYPTSITDLSVPSNYEALNLHVGDTFKLTYTANNPLDLPLIFESSNLEAISVDNEGNITVLKSTSEPITIRAYYQTNNLSIREATIELQAI